MEVDVKNSSKLTHFLTKEVGRDYSVGRALSCEVEGPDSRLACKTPPCTLVAPGALKIYCECNVLQVLIQIISLVVLALQRVEKPGLFPGINRVF